jgi:hypothetical protein
LKLNLKIGTQRLNFSNNSINVVSLLKRAKTEFASTVYKNVSVGCIYKADAKAILEAWEVIIKTVWYRLMIL